MICKYMHPQYITELYNISSKILQKPAIHEYPSPLYKYNYNDLTFYVKHEDKLALGCAKQRSIFYMLDQSTQRGNKRYSVSSSGNAALVAAYFARRSTNLVDDLKILLSVGISDYKLNNFIKYLSLNITVNELRKGIQVNNITFDLSPNPKQRAFQLEKEDYTNLRGSTDDDALTGFKSIGIEIATELETAADAIFVAASSGTTAQGIYQGFLDIKQKPAMHIVQTTKVNALVKKIIKNKFDLETEHPAESIVDVIGHRRKSIENIIHESGGAGWIISAEECKKAKEELLKQFNIEASYDSALTYAAFKKAREIYKFQNPVLVFTG